MQESGPLKGEIPGDDLQLSVAEIDLRVEFADGGEAAADGVGGADVGFVDEGFDGVVAEVRRHALQQLDDVVDSEQPVDVAEFRLLVCGKVGREGAVGGAAPPLVLAGGA